ncbi:MAG: helix-turn-helix domain-containing protein [Parasphingopyxis sp.]|uniref:helix-turn-helix domain-containing protein n=1 Tax=Parasphingopyxis sp. TaxID=1920299 RepID=UPI003FA048D1
MDTVRSHWPSLVRTIRSRRGWSQSVLAEHLGVDQTTISRWERDIDKPGIRLRRVLLDMHRVGMADRQDQVIRKRVRNAFWPSSLVAPGARFLEISQSALNQIGHRNDELRGKSIYGLFGQRVDEVTERWEASGIFQGEIAMTVSVNSFVEQDTRFHVKTMDTPHHTSDGDIWCVCEIQLIGATEYGRLKGFFGGDTLQVPFDELSR